MKSGARQLVEPLAIVAVCTVAAVGYGLVHDQITIRVCPEYFTITHPKIVDSHSLTVIALAWGVAATWWMGAALGLLVAVAARAGSEPRIAAAGLVRPVGALLGTCAGAALLAGVSGWILATLGAVGLRGELAADISGAMHRRFIAAWWTHIASYGVGGLGGLVLVGWILRARWKQTRLSVH